MVKLEMHCKNWKYKLQLIVKSTEMESIFLSASTSKEHSCKLVIEKWLFF